LPALQLRATPEANAGKWKAEYGNAGNARRQRSQMEGTLCSTYGRVGERSDTGRKARQETLATLIALLDVVHI